MYNEVLNNRCVPQALLCLLQKMIKGTHLFPLIFFFPLIDTLSGKIKFHFKIIQSSWYIFLSHAKSIIKSDFLTNVESKHCYKIMITLA